MRHSCSKRLPSGVLKLRRASLAPPSGVFCLEKSGQPSRLISMGMSWGSSTVSGANSVKGAASSGLLKPYPLCWTYININSTYTTYATLSNDDECSILQVNCRHFPLEVPIKFHWRSPSLPLRVPILSISSPLLLPLRVPIASIESPHVSIEAPHAFHWESPSFQTPHGTTIDPYKPRFCGDFGAVSTRVQRLAVMARSVLAIEGPHRFHWRSPSAVYSCFMDSERTAEGPLSGPPPDRSPPLPLEVPIRLCPGPHLPLEVPMSSAPLRQSGVPDRRRVSQGGLTLTYRRDVRGKRSGPPPTPDI